MIVLHIMHGNSGREVICSVEDHDGFDYCTQSFFFTLIWIHINILDLFGNEKNI